MSDTAWVLIPPSETKAIGGVAPGEGGVFDHTLAGHRREVVKSLRALVRTGTLASQSSVLKVRGPLFERAVADTKALVASRALVLPAWQRYQGVVWSHLDPATLDEEQRRRLLVPSGLYGLNAAVDPIADYRLTMKAALPPLGGLAAWWRRPLASVLDGLDGTFINLLPQEHASAFDVAGLEQSGRMLCIAFVQHGGDGAAGHDAKAVKGVLARTLVQSGLASFDTFEWRGWRARRRAGRYEIVAPEPTARPSVG